MTSSMKGDCVIIRYDHHGANVAVREDLKGKHQAHCLCFDNCAKFKPGTAGNCSIAQATFENCVKFNTVTPMWECPEYIEDVPAE